MTIRPLSNCGKRALALLLGLWLPTAAGAEAEGGAQFQDWTVTCAPAGAETRACALTQRLADPSDGRFLGEVGLNPLGSGAERRLVMVLRTPDGVLLTARPAFRVGAGEPVALVWHSCAEARCSALLTLEPAHITALRRGLTMVVGYQPLGRDGPVTFPVSLRGVTAGLRALGVP